MLDFIRTKSRPRPNSDENCLLVQWISQLFLFVVMLAYVPPSGSDRQRHGYGKPYYNTVHSEVRSRHNPTKQNELEEDMNPVTVEETLVLQCYECKGEEQVRRLVFLSDVGRGRVCERTARGGFGFAVVCLQMVICVLSFSA